MSVQAPPDPLTLELVDSTGYPYAEIHAALERLADAGLPPEEAMDAIEELAERGYTPEESATFTVSLIRAADLGPGILTTDTWGGMPLTVRARGVAAGVLTGVGKVAERLARLIAGDEAGA